MAELIAENEFGTYETEISVLPLNIKEARWTDKGGKEINCLLYGVKEVYVSIDLHNSCKNKRIRIAFKKYNSVLPNTDIKAIPYSVSNDELNQLLPVTFNIDDYVKHDEQDSGEYIFEITIDKEEYKPKKKLKVHAVIYIPEIMTSFGWKVATQSQIDWFNGKANNYPWERAPIVPGLSIEWALKFERVKRRYDEIKDMWKTTNAIIQLKKEIKKMVGKGYANIPSTVGQKTNFGTFNVEPILEELRNHKEVEGGKAKEKFPTFDYFHFQDQVYEESTFSDLDDFYGSIANCNFRFVAKGYLEKQKDNSILATITQIGIYLRDGFDYVGNQQLGYWSLKEKKVSRNPFSNPFTKDTYRLIDNKSYRDYRKDSGMGGDFYRYSDIKIMSVNHQFIYE